MKKILTGVWFICFSFLAGGGVSAETITVSVASESTIKINAVREAFKRSFPAHQIKVHGNKVQVSTPEQPVGLINGKICAERRFQSLKNQENKADYLVSIENYIDSKSLNQWEDLAVVNIYDVNKKVKKIALSEAVKVPARYVDKAFEESKVLRKMHKEGIGVTVGSVIAASDPQKKMNPADWQREKEFGGVSRQQLLSDTIFKELNRAEIAKLKAEVTLHNDFPKKGILFQDCTPIFRNPEAFHLCIGLLGKRYSEEKIDAIVGLEARGFIIGAALAYHLKVPFVPVRKKGKLPGETFSVDYIKEYGVDTFEVSSGALNKGAKVLIVDDLIATGGSAIAGIELVKKSGATPIGFASLLEVSDLGGRAALDIPTFNLID